jgi:diguanylate cyclase (GGDEF)-like protein
MSAEITELPQDRLAARVIAHALIEQTQVAPRPGLIDRLIAEAHARGWGEIQVLLEHCRLLHASLRGAPYEQIRDISDAMLAAADTAGDEILSALSLASRALFLVDTTHPEGTGEDLGGLLAQAVAILESAAETDPAELGARAVGLPTCFVECGQAYHRQGLWELEAEMYDRAAAALRLPVPEILRPIGDFTRRVLVVNRLESTIALASALLEIDRRKEARQVATAAVRPTAAERAGLPPLWELEVQALESFLDVVAGQSGPAAVPADLWAQLGASTWPGYRACLLLAAAVSANDGGDPAAAAAHAEQAVGLLDDYKPSLTALALRLAAGAGPEKAAALRYSAYQAALRWRVRLEVLGAARSRLAAARILREGERLSRQAYLDALTGLANRHAEIPHLARLRRRDPGNRLAVVLVDVDHFKAVNDTFGHAIGDEVLRVIGAILQAVVRPADLAVRRGGDEFLLLLELADDDSANGAAESVVNAVSRHAWEEIAPGLRASVSVGQAVGAASDVDALIEAADANLYRAKAAGRGRAVLAGG